VSGRDTNEPLLGQRAAEATLYRGEDRLRGIIAATDAAFMSTDADGVVVEWSPAAESMFGWSRREALGRPLMDLIGPDLPPGPELDALLGNGTCEPPNGRHELTLRHRQGQAFPAELTIACLPAGDSHMVNAFVRDISSQRQAEHERRLVEERLAHQSSHDPLTGLPNRGRLVSNLDRALAAGGALVAVLVIDVDDLRVVNDGLGHKAGDELLVSIAGRLRGTVRGGAAGDRDALARLAGAEFAVVCADVAGPDDAIAAAERIAAALSAPFQIAGERVFVSVSTGIAISEDRTSAESLLGNADMAMHEAKAGGPGRYQVFDAAMRERNVDRLRAQSELRMAIQRNELRLHYQPIVSVVDGGLVGAEALVRWQHPARGLLGPDSFLPLAEETGLIVPIGHWVLETAFAQAAEWHRVQPVERQVRIAVNVSGHQLADGGIVPLVTGQLRDSGLAPSRLALEITESVLMTELDRPIAALRELQALGVRIVLDDFGTGYSSLSYLRRLALDGVKLDRSFVSALEDSPTDRQIVAAVVQLAQALRMTVIGEGVETPGQLDCLRGLGCHFVQGYHLGRPMPAEELGEMLGIAETTKGGS
jgi:diguanylate cyclase (GGDEF)-like protein/PAS domain S-box-containing protein